MALVALSQTTGSGPWTWQHEIGAEAKLEPGHYLLDYLKMELHDPGHLLNKVVL